MCVCTYVDQIMNTYPDMGQSTPSPLNWELLGQNIRPARKLMTLILLLLSTWYVININLHNICILLIVKFVLHESWAFL